MSPRRRDESGLVGVILTIVIVWALVAVVMLTRTLVAAKQIDTRVLDITASVSGANKHLQTGCDPAHLDVCPTTELPVLTGTEHLASQIDAAAKPLTGQAGQIISTVGSINTTASQILSTATSINGTVHSIHDLVFTIGSSVNGINASLSGVNGDVVYVRGQVAGINNRAAAAAPVVDGIKADTGNINNLAGSILTQAQGICADRPVKVASILPVLGPIC